MTGALWISIKVLSGVIPALAILGIGLGLLLARGTFRGRELLRLITMLPMALPPSVLGLYLLMLMSHSPTLRSWGFLFDLPAAILAALLAALPIIVSSCRAGFLSVSREYEEAARTLGKTNWQIFWTITLPLARRHVLSGLAMASIRAAGDFGTTLMVAGNMAGRTQTLPLYIYSRVEILDLAGANQAALLLLGLASITLFFVLSMEQEAKSHGVA